MNEEDALDLPPVPSIAERRGLSLVWIVPIVALIVGGVLLARGWLQKGPTLTVAFHTAEGLEPGRTEVRFKEVVIGRVTHVSFGSGRERVLVRIALDKSVESLAVEDTRFWVVRPRIGAAGISGLNTLLSGVYIGVDAGESIVSRTEFDGLESAPLVLRGEPGRSFALDAKDLGSLDVGSPLYYKRTRVGRVVGYSLDVKTDRVTVQVFVESPYEKLVTPQSRFWSASGINVAVDAGGLSVNTQSLASVLAGGLAFTNPPEAAIGSVPSAGHRFRLFADERTALAAPDGVPVRVRMLFRHSVRGLAVGAPVDLLGVEIGSVERVMLTPSAAGTQFPVEVLATIYPNRLGARLPAETQAVAGARPDHRYLKRLVEQGLRAQVRSGNLLTGQLYVALEFMPRAAPATLDARAAVPTLPTVPAALVDLQEQFGEIAARLAKLPIESLGQDLQLALQSANRAGAGMQETLIAANALMRQLGPQAQAALGDVRQTLVAAQTTLASIDRQVADADAPLQRNANAALAEVQRAARALRVLADYLQQNPQSLLLGKPDQTPLRTEVAP